MFTHTITSFGVPDGIVSLPIDPVITSGVVLGFILACALSLWVLARPVTAARPMPRPVRKAEHLDKAA